MSKVFEEKNVIGDLVQYEQPSTMSRIKGSILAGAGVLAIGLVLGQLTMSDVTVAKDNANTGNGTAAAGATLGVDAMPGDYVLECVEASANAATFKVVAPNGLSLPDLKTGEAYVSSHINLTLSDGATDFVVGDKFTVSVTGTKKYVPYEAGAMDGSGVVAGILLENLDVGNDADVETLILNRDAKVAWHGLNFDASVDDQAKRQAVKDGLMALGIVTVEGA
tara:strand:+ start:4757 stop:5422 length:666 start_codon:yes stop_codon:yes gene_type:complete